MTLKEYIEELEILYSNAHSRKATAVPKYAVINGVDHRHASKALSEMDVDDALAYADRDIDNVVPFDWVG